MGQSVVYGGFWMFVAIFLAILTIVLLGWGIIALYKKIFAKDNPKDIKKAREEWNEKLKDRRKWN